MKLGSTLMAVAAANMKDLSGSLVLGDWADEVDVFRLLLEKYRVWSLGQSATVGEVEADC